MSSQHHGTVCITCRRRGKKCNKELPSCSTCTGKGIVCEGYTFRWSGVASRGKLAGKKIPVADESTNATVKSRASSAKTKAGPIVRKQSSAPIPTIQWPEEPTKREPGTEDGPVQGRKQVGMRKLVRMNSTDGVNVEPSVLSASDIIELDFNTIRNLVPQSTVRRHSESDVVVVQDVNPTQYWRPSRPLDTYNIPPEIRHVVDYCEFQRAPR